MIANVSLRLLCLILNRLPAGCCCSAAHRLSKTSSRSAAAREQRLLIAVVSAGSTPREKPVVCFGQPGLTGRPRGVTVRAGAVEEVSLVAVELQVSVGAADATRHSAGGRPWHSRGAGCSGSGERSRGERWDSPSPGAVAHRARALGQVGLAPLARASMPATAGRPTRRGSTVGRHVNSSNMRGTPTDGRGVVTPHNAPPAARARSHLLFWLIL
jgi:hypothetical protein